MRTYQDHRHIWLDETVKIIEKFITSIKPSCS